MKWKDLLETYGGGEFPKYLETKRWLEGGVSERDAWDNEERADNLLWLAQELGYCDQETLDKVACLLVDRVATIAPDVADITACYSKPGGRIAAYHERLAVEAIEAERQAKVDVLEPDGKEEPKEETIPAPVATVSEVPGASQARFAASCIVNCDHVKAATFSLKAKAQEAQAAWCAAMADETATKAEQQELQAAQARVLRMESAEQCKVVRSMIGGPK